MKRKLKDIVFPKGSAIRKFLVNLKQNGIRDTLSKIRSYDIKGQNDNLKAYKQWILENEPDKDILEKQKTEAFPKMPKISIVVPLYNTNKKYFKELLNSILNQTYTNWELCLADGSTEKNLEIEEISKKDNRIHYKFIGNNLGIARNSNAAIEMATGEYIGLLDHDDLLTEFALYEVVKQINKTPDAKLIYSDEDKISENSKERFDPHFKPDFAIDTLRSVNYICHFAVIKSEMLKEIEGFREGFDGAQDYDLFLRIAEKTNKIVHIPKILYHWRVHEGSTASATKDTKPYAYEAGKKALENHLERIGLNGIVEHGELLGTYKITYEVIGNPKISILIPNKDHIKDLKQCIESILKHTTYINYEILIIENNSTEKATFSYYEEIQKNEKIRIISYPEKEFNYAKIMNYGVKNSIGIYILQLNNDTEVLTPNWLEQFLGYGQRNDVGVVGAKLYFPDNTIQHAGIIVGINGTAGHILRNLPKVKKAYSGRQGYVQNFSSVTGACLFTKKSIYEEIGGMDEDFAVAFNDIDLCLKICQKGYWIVWSPYIELYHFESKSRGYETTTSKVERFEKETKMFKEKWKEFLKNGDPFFNINFSLESENYQIKCKNHGG